MDVLVITFGTAWIYEKVKDRTVVANCHKMPAVNFRKRLLTINEIIKTYKGLITKIKEVTPKINILFTVSPVRHIKNGIIENKRSKSILLESIHQLVEEHEACEYFPSYEIMIDDLRDYRFYESDMLHPNQQAIDHIWNFFEQTYFSEQTVSLNKEISSLKRSLNHKPLIKGTNAQKKFNTDTLQKIHDFNRSYPNILPIQIN